MGPPAGRPVRVGLRTTPQQTGDTWPSYRPSNVVMVSPPTTVITIFVVYDPERGDGFARHRGDTGEKDRKTAPQARPSPWVSVSTPVSQSPCDAKVTGVGPEEHAGSAHQLTGCAVAGTAARHSGYEH
ncbi:DUF6777 domain-containing protein [Streptomyces blattellae]|uniref:DUF6777 domain-containing protein n=1 Tax=Streptomyces blattellae TaxID=2569855 RepID=UPI0012B80876|nr:DUF6777 domain-containing protein [Streptomyces blattellae]